MKKSIFIGVLIFTMIGVYSADRHVGQGQTYTTIQAAVDDASAGDVIIIHDGTYREQVRLGVNNITIQPNGNDSVLIKGTEPLLSWTPVGNGVYKTIMDWDINETDQTNQIFVDEKMIYLTRWPDQTNDDYVLSPVMAEMNGVEEININTGEITDFEFDAEQDTALWEGGHIFINLSNPDCRMDGHGKTETIEIVDGKIRVRAFGAGRYKDCDNWAIAAGSKYYLFNPTPEGVAATGGVTALLSNGEWWKHNDTLFIKMPDGGAPASSLGESNLVEAKKYPFAFRPDSGGTFSNVTIKDINLFATSITTDDNYNERTDIAAGSNNVLDNLNVKYVTHSDDASGDFQQQWAHNSGIIISGSNNVLKNSSIVYSNVAGVTVLGNSNSVLNCIIHDVNYNLNELGAFSTGYRRAPSVNHNIGYNTIYNTPHCGISIRGLNMHAEEVTYGQARIHHNRLFNCITRVHDAGIIDGSKNTHGLRIDHNIMYDSPDWLKIGIYLDYGIQIGDSTDYPAELIVDHNVIYNVWSPIMLNACSYVQVYNNTLQHSTNWRDIGGVHLQDKEVYVQNNIASDIDDFGDFAVINHNFSMSTANNNNYFTDAANGDFTLTANATEVIDSGINVLPYNGLVKDAPDIGAYEYGKPTWEAGATDSVLQFYKLAITAANGKVHPASHLYRKGEIVPVVAEDKLGYVFSHWSGDITGDSNVVEITMDSNITATANYTPTHTYTLNIESINGKVYRQPSRGQFNPGEEVQLTAVRDAEIYEFSGWTGSITDSTNPITITMDETKTITANFPLRPVYNVTTSATNGTIKLNPDGGEYFEGTEVNILAIADSGYAFSHWSGDTNLFDYSINRQNVVINQNMSITANFIPSQGIADHTGSEMDVNIYPNPNKGDVLNITTGTIKNSVNVRILNLTGSNIYEKTFNANDFEIKLSEINIKTGFYVIEIIADDKIAKKQLIIN